MNKAYAVWTNKDTYNANKNLVHLNGDLWEEFIGIETPDALRKFYRKAEVQTSRRYAVNGVNPFFPVHIWRKKNVNWQEIFESHCEAAV
jgi:hypothetical protein